MSARIAVIAANGRTRGYEDKPYARTIDRPSWTAPGDPQTYRVRLSRKTCEWTSPLVLSALPGRGTEILPTPEAGPHERCIYAQSEALVPGITPVDGTLYFDRGLLLLAQGGRLLLLGVEGSLVATVPPLEYDRIEVEGEVLGTPEKGCVAVAPDGAMFLYRCSKWVFIYSPPDLWIDEGERNLRVHAQKWEPALRNALSGLRDAGVEAPVSIPVPATDAPNSRWYFQPAWMHDYVSQRGRELSPRTAHIALVAEMEKLRLMVDPHGADLYRVVDMVRAALSAAAPGDGERRQHDLRRVIDQFNAFAAAFEHIPTPDKGRAQTLVALGLDALVEYNGSLGVGNESRCRAAFSRLVAWGNDLAAQTPKKKEEAPQREPPKPEATLVGIPFGNVPETLRVKDPAVVPYVNSILRVSSDVLFVYAKHKSLAAAVKIMAVLFGHVVTRAAECAPAEAASIAQWFEACPVVRSLDTLKDEAPDVVLNAGVLPFVQYFREGLRGASFVDPRDLWEVLVRAADLEGKMPTEYSESFAATAATVEVLFGSDSKGGPNDLWESVAEAGQHYAQRVSNALDRGDEHPAVLGALWVAVSLLDDFVPTKRTSALAHASRAWTSLQVLTTVSELLDAVDNAYTNAVYPADRNVWIQAVLRNYGKVLALRGLVGEKNRDARSAGHWNDVTRCALARRVEERWKLRGHFALPGFEGCDEEVLQDHIGRTRFLCAGYVDTQTAFHGEDHGRRLRAYLEQRARMDNGPAAGVLKGMALDLVGVEVPLGDRFARYEAQLKAPMKDEVAAEFFGACWVVIQHSGMSAAHGDRLWSHLRYVLRTLWCTVSTNSNSIDHCDTIARMVGRLFAAVGPRCGSEEDVAFGKALAPVQRALVEYLYTRAFLLFEPAPKEVGDRDYQEGTLSFLTQLCTVPAIRGVLCKELDRRVGKALSDLVVLAASRRSRRHTALLLEMAGFIDDAYPYRGNEACQDIARRPELGPLALMIPCLANRGVSIVREDQGNEEAELSRLMAIRSCFPLVSRYMETEDAPRDTYLSVVHQCREHRKEDYLAGHSLHDLDREERLRTYGDHFEGDEYDRLRVLFGGVARPPEHVGESVREPSMLERETAAAVWQVGATQSTRGARDVIVGLLAKHAKSQKTLRSTVGKFLSSTYGEAAVGYVLGVILPAMREGDERVAQLARELRVGAETTALVQVLDPLRKMFLGALDAAVETALPPEVPAKVLSTAEAGVSFEAPEPEAVPATTDEG